MQIPILNGIYADNSPELRTSYPVNMQPVPKKTGVSNGFLRPADGIELLGTGSGLDRGGINWRGVCFRVMGTKLVTVSSSGVVTELGDVGGSTDSLVTFDYGFDRLSIASGGKLYYWNGATLTQVTDPDLGVVLDQLWVDGYYMTTDGTSLIVTELNDPLAVNPLKYGSSEADPDPIVSLLKLRNEPHALNRHTIEVFDNIGGTLFPFARIEGAQIQKGVIGTHACCLYLDRIAFLGSGRNEAPSVYLAASGSVQKISTQEIDTLILQYTEAQLSKCLLECRNDKNSQLLYVHLPDRTVVYDAAASQELGEPVWFVLTTSTVGFSQYRARNFVFCYDHRWLVGDPQSNSIGYLNSTTGHHWGKKVRWEFGAGIAYNASRGATFNEMELVALTGSVALGLNPVISTSYSTDGKAWSQDRGISVGTTGANKRLAWYQNGHMRNWRIQRFRGDSDAHISFVRLEAQIEALAF